MTQETQGELLKAPEDELYINTRRDNCSLDDAYIFNYVQNPKAGKTAALRAAGFQGDYIRQEAYRMHARLKEKIDQVLKEKTRDLRGAAHQQLANILDADSAEIGAATMLAAIKLSIDYADKYTPENTIQARPQLTEIQRRIEQLQQQIRETGA